jgi:hypothetical protein
MVGFKRQRRGEVSSEGIYEEEEAFELPSCING